MHSNRETVEKTGLLPMIHDVNEELLQQDFMAASLLPGKQEELVKQYCVEIEKRIHAAHSESEARRIADEACENFESECDSSVMRSFLRKHVYSLFDERWHAKS